MTTTGEGTLDTNAMSAVIYAERLPRLPVVETARAFFCPNFFFLHFFVDHHLLEQLVDSAVRTLFSSECVFFLYKTSDTDYNQIGNIKMAKTGVFSITR